MQIGPSLLPSLILYEGLKIVTGIQRPLMTEIEKRRSKQIKDQARAKW